MATPGQNPTPKERASSLENRRRLRRRGRVKKGGYCHLTGDYYLVTCRVLLRRYLFKPDRAITNAFKWAFGEYAKRHGIRIVAVCVMSTHYHLAVLDTRGLLPKFRSSVLRHQRVRASASRGEPLTWARAHRGRVKRCGYPCRVPTYTG